MSLVYEALQKAEREKGRKSGVPPAEPRPVAPMRPTPPVQLAPAPQRWPALVTVLVACVAVVAIVAIVWLVKNVSPREAKPTLTVSDGGTRVVVPAPPSAAVPAQASSSAPMPAGATENDPRFKLTGIMKMGDAYGAVINGHVVYDGHYVDGAVVKKVERDRVTLDLNGRETVIRLF